MSSSPTRPLNILYFGEDSSLINKLYEIYGESNVIQSSDLNHAFRILKEKYVKAIVFDTYQTEPFKGINSTDLDLLIYYSTYEEGLNKMANFLPIDPIEDVNLNSAASYYNELYEKHLFLLPATTKAELCEDSINQPEGMEMLSSLVGLLDDETDKLDKRLEKVSLTSDPKTQSQSENHVNLRDEKHNVGGFEEEKDNFKATLTGETENEEEAQTVNGSAQEGESSQRVKGSSEAQDDHKEVIAGSANEEEDDAQRVKGSSEAQDDHKEVIAGSANREDDDAQRVKGSSEAQDDHKEVIAGSANEEDDDAQRVKGSSEAQDDHKEVIAGSANEEDDDAQRVKGSSEAQDDHKEVIAGDSNEEDTDKLVVPGTSSKSDSTENNEKQVITDEAQEEESKTIISGDTDDEPGFYELKKIKKQSSAEIPKEESTDINQRNDNGQTPPMVFAMKGEVEAVKSLLSSGAKADLLCHKGKTLLHYAAAGTNDLEFIEELVHVHKLKVTKRDSDGLDPMYEAIRYDNDELINFFLNEGSRINAKYKGEPVLHVAARHNALKAFKVLLLQGADLKVMNGNRENIINYCKKQKKLPFLKLITAVNKLKEIKATNPQEEKNSKAS